jgi:hypothetical protein
MPDNLAALNDAEYARLGKKATLKMDLVIMPIMVIMYVLNYLDRQNIASAKLANITDDLNLSQVQYQTTVSILFVGYSTPPSLPPLSTGVRESQPLLDQVTNALCSSYAGTFEHDCQQDQMARHIHLRWHGRMGCHLRPHGCRSQLRGSPDGAFLPRIH